MRAVLFDLDGVLVDSYRAHLRSWQRLAAENGLPLSEEAFARSFGRKSREVIRAWWPGRASDTEALAARKEALYRKELASHYPDMPGAATLVKALARAGFALAVASSGPLENAEIVLDHLQVRDCFAAVITGGDVSRGKPNPAVFLLAAERLGVPPARCVVIEDAPDGIAAAHEGGMKAIALLSTGRHREDFAAVKPERIVTSLVELAPSEAAALLGDG